MIKTTKRLILTAVIVAALPMTAFANERTAARVQGLNSAQPVQSFLSFDETNLGQNVPHLVSRVVQNYQDGDYSMASILAHRALRADPYNPTAHYFLGLTKEKQGNLKKAERHLRFANRAFANVPQSYAALGRVYVRNGKVDKARGLMGKLDTLSTADPKDVMMAKSIINTALIGG